MAVHRGVQNVFRAANERLRTRMEALTYRGRRPVICECSDTRCMEVLELRPEEYQRVRDCGYFVISHGHDMPEIEQIVERGDGYDVVEKFQLT